MVNISEACYLYASYMPSMCKLLKYGTGECLRLEMNHRLFHSVLTLCCL